MRQFLKGNHYRLGIKHSEEAKRKMSIGQLKGKTAVLQTGRGRAEKLFTCPAGTYDIT